MKNPTIDELLNMSCHDACKYGPYGKNDRPCTVTCYNRTEQWKSRNAAIKFYRFGARCCDGSERDRYMSIYMGLEDGLDVVNDQWDY